MGYFNVYIHIVLVIGLTYACTQLFWIFRKKKSMEKSIKRTILRFLALFALFVLFFINYLTPIVIQYSSRITNTAKHDELVDDIEPPAITVCFKPKFKKSVFKKYNITEDIFFENVYPDVVANHTIKVK